jgi:FtsZ-binding cell division protein ZapB
MVNNSININKTNNHLWPQNTEHKEDHGIWHWKLRKMLTIVLVKIHYLIHSNLLIYIFTSFMLMVLIWSFIGWNKEREIDHSPWTWGSVNILSAININKTNNHLWPQNTEHKEDHGIWHWKLRSWLLRGTTWRQG